MEPLYVAVVMTLPELLAGWERFLRDHWPYDRADLSEPADPKLDPLRRLDSMGLGYYTAIAAAGTEVARDLAPLVSVAQDAAKFEALEQNPQPPFSVLDVPSALNALQCVGLEVDPSALTACGNWLGKLKVPRSVQPPWPHWLLGFVGLGLGVREVYYPIAGYNVDGAIAFTPGETFEFNLQGLLGHLAGAVEAGATFKDVEPAWLDLLRVLPVLMQAQMLRPQGLLWVARIVHHGVGKNPVGEVANFLRDELKAAAAK